MPVYGLAAANTERASLRTSLERSRADIAELQRTQATSSLGSEVSKP